MYKNFIKRILDIILSFLALVILSPLLILTAFLIRIKLGAPVFFKQLRPGKNEEDIGYCFSMCTLHNALFVWK